VFRVLSNAKALVAKALTVRREERYATFASMLEDFRKIRYRRIRHKNKDEYELLAVLGRGGFGEVFKARRVSDGMLVAVKYLFSEKQSERFLKGGEESSSSISAPPTSSSTGLHGGWREPPARSSSFS
jgi:serine/threonine protein kinase